MRPLDMRQAAALSQEIERVKSLDPDGLGLQWRNAFGKRAPKELPKALLIKILLYRLQADALGDLAPRIARVLEGYAAREASKRGDNAINPSRRATPATMTIKPGSVLVREWGGRTHRVMALDVGFAWEGRNYRSLSEVARAMTGTRWNGRRFFGVDRNSERSQSASEASGGTRVRARSEFADGGGIK